MDTEKVSCNSLHTEELAGFNIIYLDSVTSTNDYLKDLAEKEYAAGTVVCAEQQTHGRGRNGRKWHNAAGKGLTFSILLRPHITVQQALIYSYIPAIVLARFLRDEYQVPAWVKWPNDIYVQGKKLAGILCESASYAKRIKYFIIGYGINICQETNDLAELQNSAISLSILQKKHFDKRIFLCKFLFRLTEIVHDFPARWETEIAGEWNSLCYHYNSKVTVFARNRQIDGIFRGISETGAAVIDTGNEVLKLVNINEFSLR
ncbi:MAG TPA: biotin--[acetyl-CoA-carboxylase] ligase [bacterium]|nr:biotin--[acetyl-CoA-carboxylase] ligase [bacterium]HPN43128.1 biotin--[acetyl-CoA-carboxylase] ligase [bacterium]